MLSRAAIKNLLADGFIEIEPLDEAHIGPNSVDLHLGPDLVTYHPRTNRVPVVDPVNGATFMAIDPKNPPPLIPVPKTTDGRWLLVPGQFYLGETLERTFTKGVVAHLDGRSTCGRLSIEAHKTAGIGDNGFNGRWTLEIEATEPVLVGPGDRLFQVYFTPCWGEGMAGVIRLLEVGWPLFSVGGHANFQLAEILELKDLYGGIHHHYQESAGVRGAAPLDK